MTVGGLGVHNAGMYGMAGLGLDIYDPVTGEFLYSDPTLTTGVGLNVDTSTPAASSGLSPTQIIDLINKSAQAAGNIYRATQSPTVVPGSQLVWNPQTGQFVPASGIYAGGPLGSFSLAGGMLPLLLIGGLVLIMAAKR